MLKLSGKAMNKKKNSRGGARKTDYGPLPYLIGYQLRRAQVRVFNDFSRHMADLDLTPGQFGVLALINANAGLNQSELGNAMGVDRSTVVSVIDRLERLGLAERRPAPNDRRSYALYLSEKGKKILAMARRRVMQHEKDIARHLSEEEHTLLLSLLKRLAED